MKVKNTSTAAVTLPNGVKIPAGKSVFVANDKWASLTLDDVVSLLLEAGYLVEVPAGDDAEVVDAPLQAGEGIRVGSRSVTLEKLGKELPVTVGSVAQPVGKVLESHASGAKFRLPAGARLAGIGSSTMEYNTAGNATTISSRLRGPISWAKRLNPGFNWTNWFDAGSPRFWSGSNYGISGTALSGQEASVTAVAAAKYDAAVLYVGSNDLSNGTAPSSILAGAKDFIAELHDAGVATFISTVHPRATTGTNALAADSVVWRNRLRYNDMLRDFCAASPDVALIDPEQYIANMASARREFLPDATVDGLHLSNIGGFLASKAYLPVFASHFEQGSTFVDLDPTVNNIYGNGLLTGTGGVAVTNVTGTVPDMVRFSKTAAGSTTCVVSIVPDAEKGNTMRCVFTIGDVTAAEWRMQFTPDAAFSNDSFAVASYPQLAGKWVRTALKVYIEDGAEFLTGMQLFAQNRTSRNGAGTLTSDDGSGGGAGVLGGSLVAEGKTFWLITEPMFVTPDTTHVGVSFRPVIGGAASGSLIMEVSHPKTWIVNDPR